LRPDEPAQVRALLSQWELKSIIDIHTHFLPDRMMAKVWAYFDSAAPLTGRAWPITYRLPQNERVALLRSFGVEHFTALTYPHKPGMATWLNDWGAQFAAATPGCLQSATFFPEPGVEAYVSEAITGGARIFKAHVQVGGYDPNDALLEPAWGLLAEAGIPVVIHCGSGPAPGKHTGPDPIGALLSRHPELTLIVAHMGMPEYGEFLDLAAQFPNVHLDTTMAFTDFTEAIQAFPQERRPQLLDLGHKVLFGSDFPNIPYAYRHALESLERLDLGTEWLQGVLRDNAARLMSV